MTTNASNHVSWTPQLVAELESRDVAGETALEIATSIGVSPSAIAQARRKHLRNTRPRGRPVIA